MKKVNTLQASFFWNIVGSLLNAIASLILSILVVHISGNNVAGMFSLAFAGSQLMLTIGCFEVRIYQSTDVLEKFKFSDYFTLRIITVVLMIIASCLYICANKYYLDDTAIIMVVLCGYRVIDAISDVFQGYFQQIEHLDIAGKMLSLRVVVSTLVFGMVLFYTQNIVVSVLGMFLSALVVFLFYDCQKTKHVVLIKFNFNWEKIKGLFIECVPLFACAFMLMYVFNAPRNSIFLYLTPDEQSYYNQLFMPATIINLLIIAFRPMLTKMAFFWNDFKIISFLKYTSIILSGIGVFVIFLLLGGYFLGIPVLSVLYTNALYPYKKVLMIILLGGGANSFGNILYNILTIMRKQYALLIGYTLTSLTAFFFSDLLVLKFGLEGAALSFLTSMFVFFITAVILFLFFLFNERKKIKKNFGG